MCLHCKNDVNTLILVPWPPDISGLVPRAKDRGSLEFFLSALATHSHDGENILEKASGDGGHEQ